MLELDKIYCMDALEGLQSIDDNTIDCVITDPPYGINKKGIDNDDSLEVYYKSLPELYRVLKDDKWFITFASIGNLPDMFKENPFKYCWCGSIYYRNIQRINHCPLGRSKQSIYLVFKKGDAKRHYHIRDVKEFIYSNKSSKEFCHPGQKPLKALYDLIKFGTDESDIILDPFIGSGTTAIVCQRLNRRFIGFESNKMYYDISLKRLLNQSDRIDNWIIT